MGFWSICSHSVPSASNRPAILLQPYFFSLHRFCASLPNIHRHSLTGCYLEANLAWVERLKAWILIGLCCFLKCISFFLCLKACTFSETAPRPIPRLRTSFLLLTALCQWAGLSELISLSPSVPHDCHHALRFWFFPASSPRVPGVGFLPGHCRWRCHLNFRPP